MTTRLLFAGAVTAVISLAIAGSAEAGPATVRIADAWLRPTPDGAPTAAGYLSITNAGTTPDRLLGGASPRARTLEVHVMSTAGGVMRMRPLAEGLALPPGRTIKLEPGSLHLMFVAPRGALKVGDRVPARLRFEKAGEIPVEFRVEARSAGAMGMR